MGVVVTVILAIIAGVLFLGRLDGRITALENDKDFSSITEQKLGVIVEVNTAGKNSLKALKEAEKKGLDNFASFDTRLKILEQSSAKERKPGKFITLSYGKSGNWGNWTGPKYCPKKHYVCGLEQRTEKKQGDGDDTGMNSLRFACCPL